MGDPEKGVREGRGLCEVSPEVVGRASRAGRKTCDQRQRSLPELTPQGTTGKRKKGQTASHPEAGQPEGLQEGPEAKAPARDGVHEVAFAGSPTALKMTPSHSLPNRPHLRLQTTWGGLQHCDVPGTTRRHCTSAWPLGRLRHVHPTSTSLESWLLGFSPSLLLCVPWRRAARADSSTWTEETPLWLPRTRRGNQPMKDSWPCLCGVFFFFSNKMKS